MIGLVAECLLGGHVLRRADESSGSRQAQTTFQHLREAKIADTHAAGAVAKNVGRFDVPMHHAPGVRAIERVRDLSEHLDGEGWGGTAALEKRPQVAANHQPHAHPRDVVVDAARAARGRFRSFLLVSLKNFAANEHDREIARKRGGGVPIVSLELEGAEGRFQLELVNDETPEKVFDRRWALALLERVISRLQTEGQRGGRPSQFEGLKTYLTGDQPQLSHAQTASDLGMSEGAVKVAVHRLRRHFRDLVRDEIAQTVSSPEEIEGELRHLWSAVGR